MRPRRLSIWLKVFCLIIVLCPIAAYASAPVPVAYVYVNETGSFAVSAYAVSSEGKLTEIKGSPFNQTAGLMIGTNGAYLIADDGWELYSYAIGPNGAIGKEVTKIDTSRYPGNGGFDSEPDFQLPVLDRTGQYVYILHHGQSNAIQTFAIEKTGELTFKGATTPDSNYYNLNSLTITGNEKFAYNIVPTPGEPRSPSTSFNAFTREGDGTLEHLGVPVVIGQSDQGYSFYPTDLTVDSSNHLVALLAVYSYGTQLGFQLVSYTIGDHGELSTTNNYDFTPWVGPPGPITMSPSGKLIAVGAAGVQFFHFNGADPISHFTGVIDATTDYAVGIAWDADNHLYALSQDGKLFVYTVTEAGVVEAAGSPYSDIPFCGTNRGEPVCPQFLVVQSIP